jgi:hypothetical protein
MKLREFVRRGAGTATSCPVTALQDTLRSEDAWGIERAQRALDAIISRDLWSARGSFSSFGDFALASPPAGLGVRTLLAAKNLRRLLIDLECHAEWARALVLICREPGRPKTFVADEGLRRFYTVPTASASIDRRLCLLHRDHPEVFALLEAREITYLQALGRSGMLRRRSSRRGCVDEGYSTNPHALLAELFLKIPPDAQREFITSRLGVLPEAAIEVALAERRVGNAGCASAGA